MAVPLKDSDTFHVTKIPCSSHRKCPKIALKILDAHVGHIVNKASVTEGGHEDRLQQW